MPIYVGLLQFTEQGQRAIKESPTRAREIIHWLEDHDFTVHGLYYTLGQYDLVSIVEAPSDEAQIHATLALNQQGFVRTSTMKAYTVEEFSKIVEQLP